MLRALFASTLLLAASAVTAVKADPTLGNDLDTCRDRQVDAKLRLELRDDIRDLQRRLGITTIYVTHDQEEALAVSDRICVMQDGQIEQIATPFELYRNPATRFVASFVGAMNFLPSEIPGATAAIRPEDVRLGVGPNPLAGTVRKVTFLGREAVVIIDTEAGEIQHLAANPSAELLAAAGQKIILHLPTDRIAQFGADGKRIG